MLILVTLIRFTSHFMPLTLIPVHLPYLLTTPGTYLGTAGEISLSLCEAALWIRQQYHFM